MRTITDIYNEYNIMPNLQLHQLRVAAVAKQICDSLDREIDTTTVVTVCLLHDMGNIIKFDLEYTKREFPEFFDEYSFEHQKNVQKEYIEKYGTDENYATESIAQELGLSESLITLLKDVIHHAKEDNPESFDFVSCLCKYADMRVGPKAVLSLENRLREWQGRDPLRAHNAELLLKNFSAIEKEIFKDSNILPSDITDESVTADIENLKNFQI